MADNSSCRLNILPFNLAPSASLKGFSGQRDAVGIRNVVTPVTLVTCSTNNWAAVSHLLTQHFFTNLAADEF